MFAIPRAVDVRKGGMFMRFRKELGFMMSKQNISSALSTWARRHARIIGIGGAIVLLFIVLVWVSRPAAPSGNAVTSGPPGALTVDERSYDFGTVSMAKGKVTRTFRLQNTGGTPITIRRMSTSCMCTNATLVVGDRRRGPYGMPGHGYIGSAFFDVDFNVRRKPAFARFFGKSAASLTLPTPTSASPKSPSIPSDDDLERVVLPVDGVELPVTWGDFGKQLTASGAIDEAKFRELYAERGGLTPDMEALFTGSGNGRIRITPENSGTLLNLLWAFGLANENKILAEGPMNDKNYGGAGGFASTGGWTLAKGDAVTHYSKHAFVKLTPEQQALVERTSQGIYRSCCGNSTYFPDCNHGMAMLGLLELMAAQGVSEDDMYRAALQVNAYWFPSTYLTLAKYFAKQGIAWDRVNPKVALGADYSSSAGFRQIQAQVEPPTSKGGGGCGV